MDSKGADQQIECWLGWLRDGSEVYKVAARRGLAGVFEERGMLEEAIELLERNVEKGVRSAETLRRLARLYQAHGDETKSLAAALTASQYQAQPLQPVPALPVDAPAPPTRAWTIRALAPYALPVVGLGTTLGTALWMLLPLLRH